MHMVGLASFVLINGGAIDDFFYGSVATQRAGRVPHQRNHIFRTISLDIPKSVSSIALEPSTLSSYYYCYPDLG